MSQHVAIRDPFILQQDPARVDHRIMVNNGITMLIIQCFPLLSGFVGKHAPFQFRINLFQSEVFQRIIAANIKPFA
ncbi:hypothetical protein AEW23_22945 [Salmonella enterica subsp. enterica serovar Enteritidis]|nr:hypothetical protein AEW23_22945 [Salmonella enterica subsp. enterica serovar Enteritidis]